MAEKTYGSRVHSISSDSICCLSHWWGIQLEPLLVFCSVVVKSPYFSIHPFLHSYMYYKINCAIPAPATSLYLHMISSHFDLQDNYLARNVVQDPGFKKVEGTNQSKTQIHNLPQLHSVIFHKLLFHDCERWTPFGGNVHCNKSAFMRICHWLGRRK